MSSKGGHKVGTRHKVAGSRNHVKFLYRTLRYSSGREAKIMFFFVGRYIQITEKSLPTPLMSSKGGHKVGTRHKVAGSRNHVKFL